MTTICTSYRILLAAMLVFMSLLLLGCQSRIPNDYLHVTAINENSGAHHTIRGKSGQWLNFGSVSAAAGGFPGAMTDISVVKDGGNMHLVGVVNFDKLRHTIRLAQGNWFPFGDVNAATRTLDRGFQKADAAIMRNPEVPLNDLHVCAVSGGGLWHTIRLPSGDWFPFGDILNAIGNTRPYHDDTFVDVACVATGMRLHVVAVTENGGLAYTQRSATGNWSRFENVKQSANDFDQRFQSVCLSAQDGAIHLLAVNRGGADAFHAFRGTDGSWFGFTEIDNEVGNTSVGRYGGVGCAVVQGELHVTAADIVNGSLRHTIRRADGSWLPFGDVENQAGSISFIRQTSID